MAAASRCRPPLLGRRYDWVGARLVTGDETASQAYRVCSVTDTRYKKPAQVKVCTYWLL
jgi:hypothetical protein